MEHEPHPRIAIADSSGLVSLVNQDDTNHEPAKHASARFATDAYTIIVPGDIYTESLNVLGKKLSPTVALATGSYLAQTRPFVIAATKPEVYREALRLYEHQAAAVSFADCVVMAVADTYQTKEIFGFDAVFTKNGYRALRQPDTDVEREAA